MQLEAHTLHLYINLSFGLCTVHSLSPPKPAGLAPPQKKKINSQTYPKLTAERFLNIFFGFF
jgi:hypothetical protein